MTTLSDPVSVQRDYYSRTASQYDEMHVDKVSEHDFALAFLIGMIDHLGIRSVLDIGSGTGRALLRIQSALPHVRVVGIEPVAELREIGHRKGLSNEALIDGDGTRLHFPDNSFDAVCEFGVLHHIPSPSQAVSEMLRVAWKAVFISDCNNFGQGKLPGRTVKQLLRTLRLWKLADFVKTRGRGYAVSKGDGLFYSYSVFSDYDMIARRCKSVHLLNTVPSGTNLYRSASHVALLGVKSSEQPS